MSTSRFNEIHAKAELWFLLLICGDKYPIISNVEFSGLITAFTSLNAKDVILKVKTILKRDPSFFQYILKIVPIDFICETNVNTISKVIQKHCTKYISPNETFMIYLKRRKNENIDRNGFIEYVAKNFDNKVDLTNPNIIIRVEVLGDTCGIAFLKSDQIIRLNNKNREN